MSGANSLREVRWCAADIGDDLIGGGESGKGRVGCGRPLRGDSRGIDCRDTYGRRRNLEDEVSNAAWL